MARKIADTRNMSRGEWLGIRRTGIGGSDAATCIDANPWSDKLTLFCDKKGMLPEKEDNFNMKIGRDLEALVAQYFMEATGKKVRQDNAVWRSEEHPFMIANIDRTVVGENAALECKTINAFSKYDLAAGEIPQQYYCQCLHYMAVMGYDRMYIAFIQFGNNFFWQTIERNDADIEVLIEAERQFWNEFVEAGIAPAANGSDSAQETLQVLHPNDNGKTVFLSTNDVRNVTELQEIKATISRLKDRQKEYEAKIKESLGDNAIGDSEKWKVSWKNQNRTTIDSTKLKEKYPEAYDACKKVSATRALRVTEHKKKERK